MSKSCDVAIVGVTGLIGDVLVNVLDDHDVGIAQLRLVDEESNAGGRLMYKGQSVKVEPLERFDFSAVKAVVFFCAPAVAAIWAEKALAAGCSVIDASGHYRAQADVPLLASGVNPAVLEGISWPAIIATPGSQAVQLAALLSAIAAEAGVQSVTVATYQSMSTLNLDAVEGLALQTGRLLNGQPAEAGALPKQAAFNLLPRTGDIDEQGSTAQEREVEEDLRRILQQADMPVSATAIVVPVFYGTAAVVQVQTQDVMPLKRLVSLIRKLPSVKLLDKPAADGYPTPVTEATGSDLVWIGRLRHDSMDMHRLNMWIVSDNLRKGVVLNALEGLRLLIKDYL
ncbi:MAG: aspartate-semialdehyde dehydrogenase [Gammaproteobacteria bacterium HGW-Gammaproteobacteria-6]|nr:MAG: aspartate-semialdehyde dehydrogenase [Gammaproteobacteria bacterium HGW-Gammaproteobacteria-6]